MASLATKIFKTFAIATTFGLVYAVPSVLDIFAKKEKKPAPPKQYGDGGFSQNALSPYEQLSIVLGTRRIPAPHLAPPWIEIDGENTLGRAVIGLAGRHEFSAPYASGSPIEVIEEHYLQGDESDGPLTIYTETVWQDAGKEFSRHSLEVDTSGDARWTLAHSPDDDDVALYDFPNFQWFRLGKKALPNEVHFDLRFDQGLYRTTGDEKGGCAFQIVLRKPGQSDIYLPEVHCQALIQTPLRAKLIVAFYEDNLTAATSTSDFWCADYANSSPQSTEGFSAYSAYYGSGTGASHVDNKPLADGGDDTTLVIFADPATITELQSPGWSIGIRQGCGYFVSRMNYSTNEYGYNGGADVDGLWFTKYSPGAGIDRTLEDQSKVVSRCAIEYVTRYYDVTPLEPNGAACYEFMTKNQQVDQITVLAGHYVDRIWNRTTQAWVTAPHISSNPAAIALHIMTTQRTVECARPLSDSQVNLTEMGEWWEFCDTYGFECNAFIEGGSWLEALALCYEAGFGKPKFVNQYSVTIEKDRSAETAVTVFSPRNADNFEARIAFERKPHAYRITFDDEEDDYQTSSELVVYAPGYSEDGAGGTTVASLFEAKHYKSITKRWHAELRGQVDLNTVHYRKNIYSLDTDSRYLVGMEGEVVGLAHYVLEDPHDWGAIVGVITNTGNIVGLELDGDVHLQPTTTGIRISKLDGTTTTAQTAMEGYGRTIIFSTPLAADSAIAEGATVTIGAVGEESIRCIVESARPNSQLGASLILVDEAPEIFA